MTPDTYTPQTYLPHSGALRAVAGTARRLGSLPACIALGCSDIGQATVRINGRTRRIYITWGRNISHEQQQWYLNNTPLRPVWIGADSGACEVEIPYGHAIEILKVLVK